MKTRTAKFLLVSAQALAFAPLVELVVFHSLWSAPLAFAAIIALGQMKCRHCGLPVWDKSVMGTRIPVRPDVLDRCPRCGHPMFDGEAQSPSGA